MDKSDNKSESSAQGDPDFYYGKQSFNFPNGDKYEGDYCAHRTGIVWREGNGTYTTHDGQTYKGEWKDDKLVEHSPTEVVYPTGDQYYGCLIKNKYEGPGIYIFDNKMSLLCEFANNKPVGDLSLIDVKGREWHGVAAPDDALLYPEHIYYNNISDTAGKGWIRYQQSKFRKSRLSDMLDMPKTVFGGGKVRNKSITHHHLSIIPISKAYSITPQHSKSLLMQASPSKSLLAGRIPGIRKSKLSVSALHHKTSSKMDVLIDKEKMLKEERRIFAKTKKTASDLQFENSDWYKNYVNFKATFEDVQRRINEEGIESLGEEERDWYEKYLKFRERYTEIMKRRKDKTSMTREQMFELFDKEELIDKCPPVKVVYPTDDCASVCECDSVKDDKDLKP